jgi:hypothetical protein
MTKVYIQTPSGVVADGKHVPPDPKNRDYARILEEVQRGEAVVEQPIITQAEVLAEIGQRLDALARSWGYDSMLSLLSYHNSTVVQFATEAGLARAWRDAVWVYAISKQGMPLTPGEFWADFPQEPVR